MQMLRGELGCCSAGEGRFARQHLLVHDGQAVLVARRGRVAVEQLGRRVLRCQTAQERRVIFLEALHESKVGHLDSPARDQQVLRFHVEVLQAVAFTHVIQRIGGVSHVDEELVARDTGGAFSPALLETLLEAHVGQLGDHDQLAVDDFDPFQREQEGCLASLMRLSDLRSQAAR